MECSTTKKLRAEVRALKRNHEKLILTLLDAALRMDTAARDIKRGDRIDALDQLRYGALHIHDAVKAWGR